MRGTRPVLVTFESFKDRDEVLRKVGTQFASDSIPRYNTYLPRPTIYKETVATMLRPTTILVQARMLKRANVHVEEDLSKRTRENRAELRKFMRQVRLTGSEEI